ncbi:acetyl-coenzyme A carboxylase carboxyltransferase beta subunit AccD [Gottschalkia acidurici 9a]|uniref:Acetyl-coenzyme A carboxylase carboxyl transferase subunit beta n=1 Tax=Gottschalkia acidurici (strain ATCC 7906 / DSM 604 / BCRC 14475 / CIP 104303 / KCTC 5404 / NCIMB 10678 / 9a) TaxID=1128398 RepID=K0B4F0_GOTA9|nr:acetyl-CoA carboxylase, carboxyltransferase subunit beta [Gottschalkia acidurici]AFS79391.1 acetyl-coenzyme A carboxylase carboxyltransferase beta subunit AccD [Gottschalkia acidurici 9a]
MFKDWFQKKKYATIPIYDNGKVSNSVVNKDMIENKDEKIELNNTIKKEKTEIEVDDNIWIKCKKCGEVLLRKDVEENKNTCTKCDLHLRINSRERIAITIDEGTFIEYDENLRSKNPLGFPEYEEKIKKAEEQSGLKEAVVTGEGKINGNPCVICVMDSNFMMASMGSAVGEKITRAVERALEKKLPVIIFCASGGARMQEAIISLMQMAKTSAALGKLSDEGLLYISVLTDPTTGGVTASFAMLGDIILAEPGAQIGFAGRRVIEQTIKQTLPEEFQKAEFVQEKGFIDKIVHRKDLKDTLGKILYIHNGGEKHE